MIVSCRNDFTSSKTTVLEPQLKVQTKILVAKPISIIASFPQNQIVVESENIPKQSLIIIPTDVLEPPTIELKRPNILSSNEMIRLMFQDVYSITPLNIQKTEDSYIYSFDTDPEPLTVTIPQNVLTSPLEIDQIKLEMKSGIEKSTGKYLVEYTFDFSSLIVDNPQRLDVSPVFKKIIMTIPNNELSIISATAYEYDSDFEIKYIDYDLEIMTKNTIGSYKKLEILTHTQGILSLVFLDNLWDSDPSIHAQLNDIIQWNYPEKISLVENQFTPIQFETAWSLQNSSLNNSLFWYAEMVLDNNKINNSMIQNNESIIKIKFNQDNSLSRNKSIDLTCNSASYAERTDRIIDLVNAGPDEIAVSGNSSIFLTANFLKKNQATIPSNDLFPRELLMLHAIRLQYENNYGIALEPKEERDLILVHSFDDFISLTCKLPPLKTCVNYNPHMVYGTEAMHGDEIAIYLENYFITKFNANSMGNWGPYYLTHGCKGQNITFFLNGELIDVNQNWAQGGMPPNPITGFILEPY